MKTTSRYTGPALALALLVGLPASTTAGDEDKLVVKYSVHAKDKKVGTTKAVITNTDNSGATEQAARKPATPAPMTNTSVKKCGTCFG